MDTAAAVNVASASSPCRLVEGAPIDTVTYGHLVQRQPVDKLLARHASESDPAALADAFVQPAIQLGAFPILQLSAVYANDAGTAELAATALQH